VRIVGRFASERTAGETFPAWLERAGGPAVLAGELADLDTFPDPEEDPGLYVDYDETGPYEAAVGTGECAGV
jgi:sulfite reductase (ferredoxin)